MDTTEGVQPVCGGEEAKKNRGHQTSGSPGKEKRQRNISVEGRKIDGKALQSALGQGNKILKRGRQISDAQAKKARKKVCLNSCGKQKEWGWGKDNSEAWNVKRKGGTRQFRKQDKSGGTKKGG